VLPVQPPLKGRQVVPATVVTPGSALRRSMTASCTAIALSMVGYFDSRRPMLNVSAESGLKPGSIARRFTKVRTMRAEPTSSTSASATCAAISAWRAK
jgi:hypothetical protein